MLPGQNDELNWYWVAKVNGHTKPWALISAWCDYTGWGCRDGCTVTFHDTPEDAASAVDGAPRGADARQPRTALLAQIAGTTPYGAADIHPEPPISDPVPSERSLTADGGGSVDSHGAALAGSTPASRISDPVQEAREAVCDWERHFNNVEAFGAALDRLIAAARAQGQQEERDRVAVLIAWASAAVLVADGAWCDACSTAEGEHEDDCWVPPLAAALREAKP